MPLNGQSKWKVSSRGYLHTNVVYMYSISVYNTPRYWKQYITMGIAPYWTLFDVNCPLRGGYFHSIYTTMEIAPYWVFSYVNLS